MKKSLLIILFVCGIISIRAQVNAKIDEFGKHIFTLVKNMDKVGLVKFLPTKKDLVEYIATSGISEKGKEDFLASLNGHLKKMDEDMFTSVRKVNAEAIEKGVIWKNTIYKITDVKNIPKGNEKIFTPIQIMICFTYNDKTYGLQTDCIIAKRGTLLVNRFTLHTD